MAVDAEAGAARNLCGFKRTLLVLVLGLLALSAESLSVDPAGKTQTVNGNVTISCKSPYPPRLKTYRVSSLSVQEAKVKDNDGLCLRCEASWFYLKGINITWCKWNQENSQCLNISENVTTNAAIKNEDNTFNISSILRLKHPREHSATFRCMVEHMSLPTPWRCNITLPENGSETKCHLCELWEILVPCLAVFVLLIVGILLWIRFCSPGTVAVSRPITRIFYEKEIAKAFIHGHPGFSGGLSEGPSHPPRTTSLSFALELCRALPSWAAPRHWAQRGDLV